MTLKELSKVYYLDRIIEHDRDEIRRLEEKLTGISPSLTGMPHAGGIHDKIGEGVPELVERKRRLEERVHRFVVAKETIRDWIEAIDDPQVQIMMTLRFIDLMTWQGVADAVGGNNSEDSVKKMVYRYIERGGKHHGQAEKRNE